MKKRWILGIIFLAVLALVSCTKKKTPTELDDNGKDSDKELRIPVEDDPNDTEGLDLLYEGNWSFNKDYKKPGLYNTDGTPHTLPNEFTATGNRINVIMFGAKANDKTFDNTTAVESAITASKEGDTIYFPEGTYYFSGHTLTKPYVSHISVLNKKKLVIAGASSKTTLVSLFDSETNLNNSTATLTILNSSDITISNLQFTAEVPEDKMPKDLDTSRNNPEGNQYAPQSQIVVANTDPIEVTSNIVIKDCKISYFQQNGILLRRTQDCQVLSCEIDNATDIGGTGAGYAICISGDGHESFNMVGSNMDSRYNLVKGNKIKGPYLRHAIILSYVTHNNLIDQNEIDHCQDEPLDLHGEDEFLNVFTKNKVVDCTQGAVGLGNPGSTHDATGPGNVIYGNEISGCNGGIQVSYGTPDTYIYNNEIKQCQNNSTAIRIIYGPNTSVRNNVIDTISGTGIGTAVYYSYVWNDPSLGVYLVDIQNNTYKNVDTAMYFETYQTGTKIKNNSFEGCTNTIRSDLADFVLPEASDYFTPIEGFAQVYPTQEANINRGNYTSTINPSGYYYFKGSTEEPLLNRMIFEEYELNSADIQSAEHVYIRITTTSKSAKQHFFLWAAQDLNWDASELTWGNAPYVNNPTNNPELAWDPTGEYSLDTYPYAAQLYDPNKECILITDFECVAVNEAYLTYYIDITDFIKNKLTSTNFTLIMTNETLDGAYSSVRNMIGNAKNVWPCIIFD